MQVAHGGMQCDSGVTYQKSTVKLAIIRLYRKAQWFVLHRDCSVADCMKKLDQSMMLTRAHPRAVIL